MRFHHHPEDRIIVAALVAVFLLLLAPVAAAHDHAAWIMRDTQLSWCCGPKDCERVPARVRFTPSGWAVRGWKGALKPGARGLYFRKTPDGGPWGCRNTDTNAIRCLILRETRM
jgi:hypothetical protein